MPARRRRVAQRRVRSSQATGPAAHRGHELSARPTLGDEGS
ncbi:hypothetical protein I552_7341 [Mycobacterium xenopi 3993]|nr:hypothetical protein I552_7341 [Mycobacterium xenopi 3993]